ncbi:MAG: hypothetical protein Q9178_004696 [Gyalolechia marmorata]
MVALVVAIDIFKHYDLDKNPLTEVEKMSNKDAPQELFTYLKQDEGITSDLQRLFDYRCRHSAMMAVAIDIFQHHAKPLTGIEKTSAMMAVAIDGAALTIPDRCLLFRTGDLEADGKRRP